MRSTLLALLLLFTQVEPSPIEEPEPELVIVDDVIERKTFRLTFYILRGTMYSGIYTRDGAMACSWAYPIGTQMRFPDGQVYTCLDRGMGDNYWPGYWLDVWVPSHSYGINNIERYYGLFVEAEVIRWGW